MEDGLFPHANALMDENELEEERRACYVALTRAEKKLYITAADERMFFGKMRDQDISRFVDEIPESCLERLSSRRSYASKRNVAAEYKPPTAHRPAQMKISEQKPASNAAWQVGDRVSHRKWGLGTIMAVSGGRLTISFTNPEYGVKTLSIKHAPIDKI